MKRIIIVGAAGAGKTTLAATLSKRLNIPHTELDWIFHQKYWQPMEKEEFKRTVFAIADTDRWVLCGNYYSILGKEYWEKADTVIWCDYPFLTVFPRLLRRTLRRIVTRENLGYGNYSTWRNEFFLKDSVLWWMITTWREKRRRYEGLFSNSGSFPEIRLIRLSNPKQAEALLEAVTDR